MNCWQTERNCSIFPKCLFFFFLILFLHNLPVPIPLPHVTKKNSTQQTNTLQVTLPGPSGTVKFFLRSLCWGYICFSQQSCLTFSRFVFGLSLVRQSKFQCRYSVLLFLLFYFMLQLYSSSHSHAF